MPPDLRFVCDLLAEILGCCHLEGYQQCSTAPAAISMPYCGTSGDILDFLLLQALKTPGVMSRCPAILRFSCEQPHRKTGGRKALFGKTDFLSQGDEPGVRAQAVVDGISVEQSEIGITFGIGLL
jgi:hypothetical protein